jgi:hypothetical protein
MTLFLALAQLWVTRYQQRIATRLAGGAPSEGGFGKPPGF